MQVKSQVTAGFTTVASTCTGTPVTIQNTSSGASSYFWSFCAADFSTTPEGTNLGNPGGLLSSPVFGTYVQDDNGDFYGLVDNYTAGNLIRLSFGSSLLNVPTEEDLGNFGGALPAQSEGLQLLRVNGKWIAILVGGSGLIPNSSPRVVKIDFGSSLANPGTATNWGNVGGLALPHDLFVSYEGGNYIGYAINVTDNTITRLNFGADFSSPPTGVNLGNLGGINYPAGFSFVHYSGNWYCFIANRLSNSLVRLDFGASLLNLPTAVNIGNPGGLLSYPRDIALFSTCDGVYGFVCNEQSNNLVKLSFGADATNPNPGAVSLGNVGNLSFPHSIADLFRVGNDIYTFIPDASTSTLSRIRFAGCQDIPGSPATSPAPITYSNPGEYTINLLVDLGLPTQTSYCRQITVYPSPTGVLTGDTVCMGNMPALSFSGKGTAPFSIEYSDGNQVFSMAGLGAQSNVPLPYPITLPGAKGFVLQKTSDATGCVTLTGLPTQVLIDPVPQTGFAGTTFCGADSAFLVLQASAGEAPFTVQYSDGSSVFTIGGVQSGVAFPAPFPTMANRVNFSLLEVKDGFGCPETTGFSPAIASVVPLPSPAISFSTMAPVCIDKAPYVISAARETTGIAGSGSYNGNGIEADGNFSPASAGPGRHTIRYIYQATNGCSAADSGVITVNSLPLPGTVPLIIACGGIPVQLTATGGGSYVWSPTGSLDHADSSSPMATVDTTTTFFVVVTDSNGCSSTDSTLVKATVSKRTAFLVPNAFTPNGDGHNDCFGIQHWGEVTIEQLDIFNRWGGMIFTTKNPAECWDGRFRGQLQPSGAYVYVIRARTPCGEVTRTGTVLLIR
jgi:gliding motility-associated-like protein